jgi:hypothetical protein
MVMADTYEGHDNGWDLRATVALVECEGVTTATVTVTTTRAGMRTDVAAWSFPRSKLSLAVRLARACAAGVLSLDAEPRLDINGRGYAHKRVFIMGKYAAAELKARGY